MPSLELKWFEPTRATSPKVTILARSLHLSCLSCVATIDGVSIMVAGYRPFVFLFRRYPR